MDQAYMQMHVSSMRTHVSSLHAHLDAETQFQDHFTCSNRFIHPLIYQISPLDENKQNKPKSIPKHDQRHAKINQDKQNKIYS